MPIAVRFNSPQALDPTQAGETGANLARLTQAGLPVSPGFILTTRAYESFIARAGACMKKLRHFSADDPQRLERQCRQLTEELLLLPVPRRVSIALHDNLQAFDISHGILVRASGATPEPVSAGHANRQDAVLNTTDAREIEEYVKQCWVSLWNTRAVMSRLMAGAELRASAMAVVVQAMAHCNVSGSGYPFNPVTGDLTQQVFYTGSTHGKPAGASDGKTDRFIVDKGTGALISQSLHPQTPVALMPEQIRALSHLLIQTEKLYGFPHEIEWGFERGLPRLLRSRPVNHITPRWTRDASSERFPSAITPLTWSLFEHSFHRSLNYAWALMAMPPFHDKWFAMYDHYIYGNQNAVEIYAEVSPLRITSLADLLSAIPLFRKQYTWVLELPMIWSRDLDNYLMDLGELMAEPLEEMNVGELWHFMQRVKNLGVNYLLPDFAISFALRAGHSILLGLLEMLYGADEAPTIFDHLLAWCETKTGVINKELYHLAARIAAESDLVKRLDASSAADFLQHGGFADTPDIQRVFDQFLRHHGHREIEFDPYHPTWIETPWLVIEYLKAMLDLPLIDPLTAERKLKLLMHQTEVALVTRLPEELRFFVRELIRLTRVYTALDDVEHYQMARLNLPLRKGARALGWALVKKGVIHEPMDVFFAGSATLEAAIRADDPQHWHELSAVIRHSKAAWLLHRNQPPQWGWGMAAAEPPADAATGTLSGIAGSPGSASGPIFRVTGWENFSSFPSGAVLVAHATSPAWLPLFFKATALVVESGSPLSHGAVTARAFGLPAVMAVRDALTRLEDGQRVTVDGTNGQITQENGNDE